MSGDYQIKIAKHEHLNSIADLCVAHAEFEGAVIERANILSHLGSHLFIENTSIFCLVIEYNGKVEGYATSMKQFSTWDAEFYMYLDCLYLNKIIRGMGIGSAIMNKIKEIALVNNCKKVQWQTPINNKSAIQFYKNIGAISFEKSRFIWKIIG